MTSWPSFETSQRGGIANSERDWLIDPGDVTLTGTSPTRPRVPRCDSREASRPSRCARAVPQRRVRHQSPIGGRVDLVRGHGQLGALARRAEEADRARTLADTPMNSGSSRGARMQRGPDGMSLTEWSAYMHDELSVPLAPMDIAREVVERIEDRLWGTAAANPRSEGGRCSDGGPVATRTGLVLQPRVDRSRAQVGWALGTGSQQRCPRKRSPEASPPTWRLPVGSTFRRIGAWPSRT